MRTAAGFFLLEWPGGACEQQQQVDAGGRQAASRIRGRRQVQFPGGGRTSEKRRVDRGRLAILKAMERFGSNPGATQSEMPLRKRWTLDDDKGLMELRAKGVPFNEIATALGRTEAAVEQRAHTLKRQAAARHLWTPN
jgi:hypothetical protein